MPQETDLKISGKRATDNSETAMVAFFVPDEISPDLAIDHPGAERAEDLHVTLAYLGDASGIQRQELIDAVTEFAKTRSPLTAVLSGLVRFTATDGDDAVCYLVQSDEIEGFRSSLIHFLAGAKIELPNKRNYVPHITVAYIRNEDDTPRIDVPDIQMTFSDIHVAYGDERVVIPLGGESDLFREMPEGLEENMKGFMRAMPDVSKRQRQRLLDDPTLPVPFTASTPGRKSDGFNLRANEWDLSRFNSHPVILWGHDYRGAMALPIGLGENVRFEGDALKMNVVYDTEDPFAMRVRAKAIKGMIAGSVSWDRVENKNQLLEFSNVNLGVDPDSLPEIERLATRSMMDDIMEGMGGGGKPERLVEVIDSLRQVVHQAFETLGEDVESRDIDPAESEDGTPAPKRAIQGWDVMDQIYPIIQERVNCWFQLMGPFFEGDSRFVVAVVDGRYWRYNFTIDEKDMVVVEDGFRVKMEFNPVSDDTETSRGMDEDEDEDEMRVEAEEERAEAEDGTVTEEEKPDVADGGERTSSDMLNNQLAAIFANVDVASRKFTEVK
jgi:2'-5' RNA ligase